MKNHLINYQKYLKSKPYFFTIDPGARTFGGTGVSLFSTKPDKINPERSRLFQPDVNIKDHNIKIESILDQIKEDIFLFQYAPPNLAVIFIERPKYFDTFKGQTAANSESLFKLIFFYGRLWQLLVNMGYRIIVPLEIVHWKGQLDKKKVSARVERICGKKYQGDVIDAVGMGLYLKGLF